MSEADRYAAAVAKTRHDSEVARRIVDAAVTDSTRAALRITREQTGHDHLVLAVAGVALYLLERLAQAEGAGPVDLWQRINGDLQKGEQACG